MSYSTYGNFIRAKRMQNTTDGDGLEGCSIRGPPGPEGPTGPQGVRGFDANSSVWLSDGTTGTFAQGRFRILINQSSYTIGLNSIDSLNNNMDTWIQSIKTGDIITIRSKLTSTRVIYFEFIRFDSGGPQYLLKVRNIDYSPSALTPPTLFPLNMECYIGYASTGVNGAVSREWEFIGNSNIFKR